MTTTKTTGTTYLVTGASGHLGRLAVHSLLERGIAASDIVATALIADDQAGRVHELGGDIAFTLEEYAATLATEAKTPVVYQDLPADDYAAALAGAGVPEGFAAILADSDLGLKRGDLFTDSGDLARLIGRPTTPPAEAIRAALA